MFLLPFLELIVGDFDTWPTDVLRDVFVEVPNHLSVGRIAAFGFGNGVPLRLLTRFAALANPHWRHINSLQIYTQYHMWKGEVDASHCAQYYNMSEGKICWINGDSHPRNEPVVNGVEPPLHQGPEELDDLAMGIALGYSNSPLDEEIVSTLNLLSCEVYELDILH